MKKLNYQGPVVLAVMDGIGLAPDSPGNAVAKAKTDFLAKACQEYPHIALAASGEAVGLRPGQMGNSEVGHNTLGSGQIVKHGIAHINEAFDSGAVWRCETWLKMMKYLRSNPHNPTLHFAGIFSDGGVHSHISHLEQMIEKAYDAGVRRFRIHCVFDGRDVAPQSEPKYINRLETFAFRFPTADIKIASGGGRMVTVADRYWEKVKMLRRGWDMIMCGRANRTFRSATEAIETLRAEDPKIQDQFLPTFVIVDSQNQPVGKVQDGDAIIYYDFRADRAVEIAEIFEHPRDFSFIHNSRKLIAQKYFFADLTEYNLEKHIPKNILIEPVKYQNVLHDFLIKKGIRQFAISETAKFGHITYYFDGNTYENAPDEHFVEIQNCHNKNLVKYPQMAAHAIAGTLINNSKDFKFLRCNFPNGDMVGHCADMDATIAAIETVDRELYRIGQKVNKLGGCLVIVADHGNAEEMLDAKGQPKTAHTTNPVPFIIYDNTKNREHYEIDNTLENPGLANVAATIALLLGENDYPKTWEKPLIKLK